MSSSIGIQLESLSAEKVSVECCCMLLFQICCRWPFCSITSSLMIRDMSSNTYLISVLYSCHLLLGKRIKFNQHVRSKEACLEHQIPYVSFSLCFSHQHLGDLPRNWGGFTESGRRFLLASAGAVVLTKGFSSQGAVILGGGRNNWRGSGEKMYQEILPSY